ncbi:MAG: ImmA/IrrE family metallo-endopeptidase [Clostridia bacterium]
MNNNYDYSRFFYSPELLANAILNEYKNENINLIFPINPFKILKDYNVKIVIRNFKNLEGLYIPANNKNDIDLVAINLNRSIYRQRFTAAHEICHLIKDKNKSIICPINGKKNEVEIFADKFAGCLLMPKYELLKQVKKYSNINGYIELYNIIYVAEYFGVSFESAVANIAYRLKKIEGNLEWNKLKNKIKTIQVNKLRKKFEIINKLNLTREIIDFYCFSIPQKNHATILKFKQFLILNENRLENIEISKEKINYILADLRLNNNYLNYKNETNKNILQALGNIDMLNYILNTDEDFSIWKIQKLQKMLYKFTKYGNELLFPRQINNIIVGAQISTVDYKLIITELIKIEEEVKILINNKNDISIHQYILECIKIHHKLTVIHPLNDGNGRICRGILIWLFKINNIPPIYIKSNDKYEYIKALNIADIKNNYDYLELFILNQIIHSMVLFDEKLIL